MDETSGVLAPVVIAFLQGEELDPAGVVILRGYLRQWIAFHGFIGPEVEGLRDGINSLTNTAQIRTWIDRAVSAGCDPL